MEIDTFCNESPIALKNGGIIHIDNVERGLKCNCFCAYCNSPLIAKKGEERVHHFAHKGKTDCTYGFETALHFAAKEIFLEIKKIKLPPYYSKYKGDKIKLSDVFEAKIDNVICEKKEINIKPDLILFIGNRKLFVEIAVNHFVDSIKRKKIEENNISTIEINLSIFKKEKYSNNILKELLINDISKKKWLFNSNEMALLNKRIPFLSVELPNRRNYLKSQIEKRREAIEKEEKNIRKIKEIQSLKNLEQNNIHQKKETIKITNEIIELSKRKIIKESNKFWYLKDCPKIFKKNNIKVRVNIWDNCIKCEYGKGFRDDKESYVCVGFHFLYDINKYNLIL